MRFHRLSVLSALVCLLAAGCKHGPPVVVKDLPPPALQGGWTPVASKDGTVSMAAPPGWSVGRANSLDPAEFDKLKQGGTTLLPNVQAQFDAGQKAQQEADEAALLKKGILLSVVDRSGSRVFGEEHQRFTVYRQTEYSGITLKDGADAVKDQLLGKGPPQPVELPIGPAIRFDCEQPMRDGSTVYRVAYVVVNDADVYLVTFTNQTSLTAFTDLAPKTLETLRIKGSAPK